MPLLPGPDPSAHPFRVHRVGDDPGVIGFKELVFGILDMGQDASVNEGVHAHPVRNC